MYGPKFDALQWLTVTAEIELLLNMVWCVVVYCVQPPVCWIFCLPWLFQSFCLSQSNPFQSWTSSIGLVSLESRSWTSKSWSWSWNCLVLVLDKQVLNPSLISHVHIHLWNLQVKFVYQCTFIRDRRSKAASWKYLARITESDHFRLWHSARLRQPACAVAYTAFNNNNNKCH